LQSETVHKIDNEMQLTGTLDSTNFWHSRAAALLNPRDCPHSMLSNQSVRI